MDLLVAISDDHQVVYFRDIAVTASPLSVLVTDALGKPRAVAAGLIDADDFVDVVVASLDEDALVWIANDGFGDFTSSLLNVLSPGIANMQGLAIHDMDGDGAIDLVGAGAIGPAAVRIWYAASPGSFPESTSIELATGYDGSNSVELVDLTRNNRADVLVAAPQANTVFYVPHIGNRTFAPPIVVASDVGNAVCTRAADLTGDGASDVVVAVAAEGAVVYFVNNGAGGFDSAARVTIATDTAQVWWIALGDINADGAVDVVSASATSGLIAWHVNLGRGSFAAGSQTIDTSLTNARFIGLEDLDRDGTPDVFVAADSAATVAWYANNGSAVAVAASSVTITTVAKRAKSIALADFNLDGTVDAAIASTSDDLFALYPNAGHGSFALATKTNVLTSLDGPIAVVAADLNADGLPDMICIAGDGLAVVMLNNPISPGTFASSPALRTDLCTTCPTPLAAAAGDLDSDGHLDVVLATSGSPSLLAFYNTGGSASFPAGAIALATGLGAVQDLVIADINGDARTDIVYVSSSTSTIAYLPGIGNGSFAPIPIPIAASGVSNVQALQLADLDANGSLDVIAALGSSMALVWIRSTSPGSFAPPATLATGAAFSSIAVGDINHDGVLDVVYAAHNSDEAGWIRGTSPGVFDPARIPFPEPAPLASDVVIADINADGLRDVVVSSAEDYTVRAFIAAAHMGSSPAHPTIDYPPARISPRPVYGAASYAHLNTLAATLRTASTCWPQRVHVAAQAPQLSGCSTAALIPIPVAARWTIAAPLDAPLAIDCHGGVLFAVHGELTLENLVITRTGSGTAADASSGLLVHGGLLTLRNATITDSTGSSDGGAVRILASGSLIASSSTFARNTAAGSGGALAVDAHADRVTLNDVTFVDNLAGRDGGAVVAAGGSIIATNVVVAGNSAAGSGGGVCAIGSGGPPSLTITFAGHLSAIRSNVAGGSGGGLAVSGAANLTMAAGRLVLNAARLGGAIAVTPALYTLPASMAQLEGLTGGPWPALAIGSDVLIGSHTADYGGLIFACVPGSALPRLAFSAIDGDAQITAAVGGGYGYVCPDTGLASAMTADAPTSTVFAADGYGSLVASPPMTVSVAEASLPAVAVSARSFGGGTIVAYDALGTAVVDPSLKAKLAVVDTGVLRGAELGIALDGQGGTGSLAGISLGLPRSAFAAGTTVSGVVDIALGRAVGSLTIEISACPPGEGRVSGTNDVLACDVCEPGLFSRTTSTEPCDVVPDCAANRVRGASGSNATVAACVCMPGFYNLARDEAGACLACPEGAVCAGGDAQPLAATGWFPSEQPEVFLACPVASACTGDGTCQAGYTSRLCAECARGYYRLGSRCLRCRAGANSAVVVALVVGCLAAIAMMLGFNLSTSLHYKFASVMIGFNALQIAALYGRLDLEWGEVARAVFSFASSLNINFELTSPECAASANADVWVLKWALALALPIFAALALGAVTCCIFVPMLAYGLLDNFAAFEGTNWSMLRWAAGRTWFQILVLIYMPLCSAALSVFGCEQARDGRWILAADPARSCYTASWMGLAAVGGSAVGVYALGVPISVWYFLRNRRRVLDRAIFSLRYAFLVARFESRWWWFEVVIMARKVGVVAAFTFVAGDVNKAHLGALLLFVATVHLAAARPYGEELHNRIAIGAMSGAFVVLFAGTGGEATMRTAGVLGGLAICLGVIVLGVALDLRRMAADEKDADAEFYSPGMVRMDSGEAIVIQSPRSSIADVELTTMVDDECSDHTRGSLLGPPSPINTIV
ncbi:uncharacterized protein AMSG_02943 [Thecamonas trahens ATCC 50062]|uniref:DUF7630 domain-containing protein n=1 Tax=Thecamonas trahens ATCC 50062 TaxID=461836 RepID=A0A0L0D2I0_THETB|nr:hypothetical protein AMSG_02943 [Thecamonas trahens ATCC 50062]KNC46507.1 hypothetical protein AMSG_02943 [Thecamonas trahens ATCC 50062]|eukprot:XP_013760288.1 hypothetical protein AMSG_02943 [Thecamonas trahens ATCC 50062]